MQNKRYYSFNQHLREKFGEKVFKVSLDAGFTCPNRDGTLGRGGCIYCSERGSGDFAGERGASIAAQFAEVRERLKQKWPSAKYLAYFQAYTNTYAPVPRLREVYEQALAQENVVGLSISTRADCLADDVLGYLGELNQTTYLWVELGLQSSHDRTLKYLNRGHTYEQFLRGLERLHALGIRVCAHIILGLPGESRADMLETARAVAGMPLQGIKIHLLHILRGTPLAAAYQARPFELLGKEEYVSLVADILEILPPGMVIQRLTGDGPPADLIGPLWSRRKWEVLNALDAELERRNSRQGQYYSQ